VTAPTKTRRLTQAEALDQVRAQILAEQVSPKPKRARDADSSGPRDRDRWITLPKHLAIYPKEQAIISQGHLWSHRIDRRAAWVDNRGAKHTPVRLVYLGPVDSLNSNYMPENKRPGQQTVEGDKTHDFVLGSDASCTNSRLTEKGVGLRRTATMI
jgi:hypothetical protein